MLKTKKAVKEAHELHKEGKYQKAIEKLVEYADRHIRKARTRHIMDEAIRNKEW